MTLPREDVIAVRSGPLKDLRVLVVGGSRAALTTASLLADYGADSVILEGDDGHPMRSVTTTDGPPELLWATLARGCRTVRPVDDDRQRWARGLVRSADVVIVDHVRGADEAFGVGLEELRAETPDLISLSVTPYGEDGPHRDVPGNDVAAEAFGGLTCITGHPERPPLHTDYPVGAAVSGLLSALGIAAALRARDLGLAQGRHVDVATYEGVLRMLEFLPAFRQAFGWPSQRTNSTSDYQTPVNRWQTADGGWLSFTGNTEDVVHRFFRALGASELIADPRFRDNAARVAHRSELETLISGWFAQRNRAEIVKAMEAEGVPIAEILDVSEVVKDPHVVARGSMLTLPSESAGPMTVAGVAGRFSRTPGAVRHLGTVEVDPAELAVAWKAAAVPPRSSDVQLQNTAPVGPLDGLKVLDIGNVIAGPLSATLLADLGADVIKVERPDRGDLFRAQAPLKDGISVWWKVCGRGKRSISLNLKDPDDLRVFQGLVREADVLVENFVPGVASSLGIDAESLAPINPRLVYVSISGYGQSGPKSRQRAFGRNAEGFGGMASITGYPDDAPQHTGFPVADSFSAALAAFGALAALHEREDPESGRGQHLDVALYESVLRFLEPATSHFAATGAVWERGQGRREPALWRRACPTADGQWVSLAASEVIGAEGIARWLGLTVEDLMVEECVDARTSRMTADELLRGAEAAGIAAARISTIDDLLDDPHLRTREMFVSLPDDDFGSVLMPGVVPRFDGRRLDVRRPAPKLDEHRSEVLEQWLGLPSSAQEERHG